MRIEVAQVIVRDEVDPRICRGLRRSPLTHRRGGVLESVVDGCRQGLSRNFINGRAAVRAGGLQRYFMWLTVGPEHESRFRTVAGAAAVDHGHNDRYSGEAGVVEG